MTTTATADRPGLNQVIEAGIRSALAELGIDPARLTPRQALAVTLAADLVAPEFPALAAAPAVVSPRPPAEPAPVELESRPLPRTGPELSLFLDSEGWRRRITIVDEAYRRWARERGFPERIAQYNTEQVRIALHEVRHRLRAFDAGTPVPAIGIDDGSDWPTPKENAS